jgi:hypothetical protein
MIEVEQAELELKEWIEAQVPMVHPERGLIFKNKHGTPYRSFGCGGERAQGSPPRLYATFLADLTKFFKLGALEYFNQVRIEGPKVLYWRMFPTIRSELHENGGVLYTCTCRFVVDRL